MSNHRRDTPFHRTSPVAPAAGEVRLFGRGSLAPEEAPIRRWTERSRSDRILRPATRAAATEPPFPDHDIDPVAGTIAPSRSPRAVPRLDSAHDVSRGLRSYLGGASDDRFHEPPLRGTRHQCLVPQGIDDSPQAGCRCWAKSGPGWLPCRVVLSARGRSQRRFRLCGRGRRWPRRRSGFPGEPSGRVSSWTSSTPGAIGSDEFSLWLPIVASIGTGGRRPCSR